MLGSRRRHPSSGCPSRLLTGLPLSAPLQTVLPQSYGQYDPIPLSPLLKPFLRLCFSPGVGSLRERASVRSGSCSPLRRATDGKASQGASTGVYRLLQTVEGHRQGTESESSGARGLRPLGVPRVAGSPARTHVKAPSGGASGGASSAWSRPHAAFFLASRRAGREREAARGSRCHALRRHGQDGPRCHKARTISLRKRSFICFTKRGLRDAFSERSRTSKLSRRPPPTRTEPPSWVLGRPPPSAPRSRPARRLPRRFSEKTMRDRRTAGSGVQRGF